MPNSRGARAIVSHLPNLGEVVRCVGNGKVVLVPGGRYHSVSTATTASRRKQERCAGDSAGIWVQVPGEDIAWAVCLVAAGRGIEILGRGGVSARENDFVCEVTRRVGEACSPNGGLVRIFGKDMVCRTAGGNLPSGRTEYVVFVSVSRPVSVSLLMTVTRLVSW